MARKRKRARFFSAGLVALLTGIALMLLGWSHLRQRVPVEPYAQGRWRLAREKLDETMLQLSHIAIAHEASDPDGLAPLRPRGFRPDRTAARKRSDAERLAQELSRALARNPDQFASLAQSHSDDALTKNRGGRMGLVSARHLPDVFLDAISVLAPGSVSRTIETPFGFHLLRIDPPAPEQLLSADRVVFAHEGAISPFDPGTPAAPIRRTRDEARASADQFVRLARAAPGDWSDLVQRHASHGADIVTNIGVWSTYEPSGIALELDILSQVAVGAVAGPVDTPLGVVVFRRTAPAEPSEFAVTSILFPFDPRAPQDSESGEARVRAVAEGIMARVRDRPSEFESLQREYCCPGARYLRAGRGPSLLEERLRHLAIGQVDDRLTRLTNSYAIAKRLEPSSYRPSPVAFQVPSPQEPDYEYLLEHGTPQSIRHIVGSIEKRALSSLNLRADQPGRLAALFENLPAALTTGETNARALAMRQAMSDAATFLDPSQVQALRTIIHETVETTLVSAAPPTRP